MSSFFTAPASQRKRKRTNASNAPASKKRNTSTTGPRLQNTTKARREREESITGSESEAEEEDGHAAHEDEEGDDLGSEGEDETAAERRLRLAERYLENVKQEVVQVDGFDAADVDRDLIAERLKEDVAETKGRLYRRIASEFSFSTASHTSFRVDQSPVTGVAACPPYAYTVSKDMRLTKWEIIPPRPTAATNGHPLPTNLTPRHRPKLIAQTKPDKTKFADPAYRGHTAPILSIAASPSGQYVATGGADRRLIIWSAATLSPLKVFPQHRDAILALSFRRGTNQLFSASADRTIKLWSLDELAYVETLFGHQDAVVDVAAFAQERCISVGARDRTARFWKVVDESQLVFRGGGGGGGGGGGAQTPSSGRAATTTTQQQQHAEGSIDRVAVVDEETFVTGSDDGSLKLWSVHKKKPVFTCPLAHGLDPPLRPEEASAEAHPHPARGVPAPPSPRWITALASVPYSDLVLSGSWDGRVRAWRVSGDRRRIEAVGAVGAVGDETTEKVNGEVEELERVDGAGDDGDVPGEQKVVRGVVNDLAVFERGERGRDGLCIVAAVGKEHRLGRWLKVKGKNGAVVFEVSRKTTSNTEDGDASRPKGEEADG